MVFEWYSTGLALDDLERIPAPMQAMSRAGWLFGEAAGSAGALQVGFSDAFRGARARHGLSLARAASPMD